MNRKHRPGGENVVFCLFPHGTLIFLMKCSFAFSGPNVSNLMTVKGAGEVRVVCDFFFLSCRADKSSKGIFLGNISNNICSFSRPALSMNRTKVINRQGRLLGFQISKHDILVTYMAGVKNKE